MTRPTTPRRIAFVSDAVYPYHKGGKEMRLYEVSRRLARAGHDVHIYTMKWWDGADVITSDGVTLHAISRLYPLYTQGRRSMREALGFGLATLRLLTEPFDVIDVDSMPFFPLFSARLVCWLRRRPLHATWHEVTNLAGWKTYLGPVSGRLAWVIERLAGHMPDTIIANSAHTTARLRATGLKQAVITVPLGVNMERIYKAAPSRHTSDVIFVGRLVAHKNADLLVRAIGLVKTTHPHISCQIIGDGPEKARLVELIRELKLEDNVQISPFVEQTSDLYGLMKASKMFVLPSIREGFSLVAIEANAAGLPVITTTHPDNAARDLIREGVNGYLTAADPAAIATRIRQILGSGSHLRPGDGLQRYNWDNVARNVELALTV